MLVKRIVAKSENPVEYAAILAATLAWIESREKVHPEEFIWVKNKTTGVGIPHFCPRMAMPIMGIDINLSDENDIARLAMLRYNEVPGDNPFFLVLRQD